MSEVNTDQADGASIGGVINLPSFDIYGITDVGDALRLIHHNIGILRGIILRADLSKVEDRDRVIRNITFLRQYYERADVLVRNSL